MNPSVSLSFQIECAAVQSQHSKRKICQCPTANGLRCVSEGAMTVISGTGSHFLLLHRPVPILYQQLTACWEHISLECRQNIKLSQKIRITNWKWYTWPLCSLKTPFVFNSHFIYYVLEHFPVGVLCGRRIVASDESRQYNTRVH